MNLIAEPNVNEVYFFKFTDSISSYIRSLTGIGSEYIRFKVDSVISINDLINMGLDVYSQYYSAYGLTLEDYKNDIRNNSKILGLSTETARVVVPFSFVIMYKKDYGVLYQRSFIISDLGFLPSDEDITRILNNLNEVIEKELGVVSESKLVQYDQSFYIDHNEHYLSLERRESRKNIDSNIYLKYDLLKANYDLLLAKFNKLLEKL